MSRLQDVLVNLVVEKQPECIVLALDLLEIEVLRPELLVELLLHVESAGSLRIRRKLRPPGPFALLMHLVPQRLH
jgi:hypothetical protein